MKKVSWPDAATFVSNVRWRWFKSHELPLDRAAEAYENFDARKEGWTKVVLKPGH